MEEFSTILFCIYFNLEENICNARCEKTHTQCHQHSKIWREVMPDPLSRWSGLSRSLCAPYLVFSSVRDSCPLARRLTLKFANRSLKSSCRICSYQSLLLSHILFWVKCRCVHPFSCLLQKCDEHLSVHLKWKAVQDSIYHLGALHLPYSVEMASIQLMSCKKSKV